MKRNAVLSIIIGALTTYLPFWEWSNTFTQISGTVVIAMLVFYFWWVQKRTPLSGNLNRSPQKIIEQPYCKAEKEKKQ